MVEIQLTNREVTATGLYLMRWQKRTGLVRIVGPPKTGWKLLKPNEKTVEALFPGLPEDGNVPEGALLSEPLTVSVQ